MYRLNIEMRDLEGGLLRLLGTTERRGWRAVVVHAVRGPDRLWVDLTVRGEGSVELLHRQLRRLHEVRDVVPAPALVGVS